MSTDRDLDVDAIVARVLAKVRAAWLLPDRPAASEPERPPLVHDGRTVTPTSGSAE